MFCKDIVNTSDLRSEDICFYVFVCIGSQEQTVVMCNGSVDLIVKGLCLSSWNLTGHIGIAVPDVYEACKLFEEQGVTFVKKPDDGKMWIWGSEEG